MERTQIHLPPEMKQRAVQLAERRGLSLAALIRLYLGDALLRDELASRSAITGDGGELLEAASGKRLAADG